MGVTTDDDAWTIEHYGSGSDRTRVELSDHADYDTQPVITRGGTVFEIGVDGTTGTIFGRDRAPLWLQRLGSRLGVEEVL